MLEQAANANAKKAKESGLPSYAQSVVLTALTKVEVLSVSDKPAGDGTNQFTVTVKGEAQMMGLTKVARHGESMPSSAVCSITGPAKGTCVTFGKKTVKFDDLHLRMSPDGNLIHVTNPEESGLVKQLYGQLGTK